MLQPCQDNYSNRFLSWADMLDYHQQQSKNSQWERTEVCKLQVAPLDSASKLTSDISKFHSGVSEESIKDTTANLGLAVKYDGNYYPLRSTAYKSLLDRAKIGGSALPKLPRKELARTINSCLALHSSSSLLLIRDQKVSAVHSGDERDYSVLPIDQLLEAVKSKLDERFPGNEFESGYYDHTITSASWRMPGQTEDLLGVYRKMLDAQGKSTLSKKLLPGVRFVTSDTGVSSAKICAMLTGLQHPIHIGGMISVDHRHQAKVDDFEKTLDQMFAQFGSSVEKLSRLDNITLNYPVNAMTRVCKKLSMPKKAAVEAIAMFEMAYGGGTASAHDVFMGLQEIIFLIKNDVSEGKLMTIQENLARALHLRWSDFDLAKAVEY